MTAVDNILDRTFGLSAKGVTAASEIRAGVTTFLTMAYILLVNPAMLSVAGIPSDDAWFATAIAAFVGCVVMGLWANLPFALAPRDGAQCELHLRGGAWHGTRMAKGPCRGFH